MSTRNIINSIGGSIERLVKIIFFRWCHSHATKPRRVNELFLQFCDFLMLLLAVNF